MPLQERSTLFKKGRKREVRFWGSGNLRYPALAIIAHYNSPIHKNHLTTSNNLEVVYLKYSQTFPGVVEPTTLALHSEGHPLVCLQCFHSLGL